MICPTFYVTVMLYSLKRVHIEVALSVCVLKNSSYKKKDFVFIFLASSLVFPLLN